MRPEVLWVSGSGTIISIGDLPLELEGEQHRNRASEILPVNPIKRVAFKLLRFCFGERGRIAEWTRQWHGPWEGRVLATGETYTHLSRRAVLAWEHERLEEFYDKLLSSDE